jgi:hypothetical protein
MWNFAVDGAASVQTKTFPDSGLILPDFLCDPKKANWLDFMPIQYERLLRARPGSANTVPPHVRTECVDLYRHLWSELLMRSLVILSSPTRSF